MNKLLLFFMVIISGGMLLGNMACDRQEVHSVREKIEHEERDTKHDISNKDQLPPKLREQVVRVSKEKGPDFFTLKRTGEMKRYPCSNCHMDRETTFSESNQSSRKAHWNVDLSHWKGGHMSCSTCHGNESSDQLQTSDGRSVSFNRPDQVCETCHGKQVQDWKGGAHGKQYQTWQGPPVRYNCTTCHDPHDPSFEKKWPETFPNIPRKPSRNHDTKGGGK